MAQGVRTPYPDLAVREHPGQPTLCTPEVIQAVASFVATGGYPTVALGAVGIDDSAHATWLRRAKEDYDSGIQDSVFIKYSEAVKRAAASWERRMIERVGQAADAGPQYWPAAMTALERRHPDRWGKRERQEAPTHATQVNIVFAPFPSVQAPSLSVSQSPDRAELTVSDTDDLGHTPPRICAPKDTGGE